MAANTAEPLPAPMRAALSTFERTEKKYVLTRNQYSLLMREIGALLHEDDFARSTVSSLYYDTAEWTMINRSIERPVYKEKLRVRAYDSVDTGDAVFVELKKKLKGVTYKRRIPLSVDGAHAYMSGADYRSAHERFPLSDTEKHAMRFSPKNLQIVSELDASIARYPNLQPRMMIVVDRLALKANERDDLRITFDFDTRWRNRDLAFQSGASGSALFDDGRIIMEVKCAKAYPLWLVRALAGLQLYCRPCSKVGNAYQAMAVVV